MGWTCAQVVIGRLVAEEDPAWASRMDDEVQKGKNAMANTSMLRSRQALAELSMQKDTTVKDALLGFMNTKFHGIAVVCFHVCSQQKYMREIIYLQNI